MLTVTLLPWCCSTRERWKDVVEWTHSQLHLQTPSSCSPLLPSLSSELACNPSAIKNTPIIQKSTWSSVLQLTPVKISSQQNELPWLKCLHRSSPMASLEEESKSSPRQWVSNFLLTYPVFPRSRAGCTFCTGLSTKQTQVQNIPLPPRLPQSLHSWIKHQFQLFCLFVNTCKWPSPHAQRQNLPPPIEFMLH